MPGAIVIVGGGPPDRRVVAHLPRGAIVIAADSGLDHAFALGLTVDLVVGDLDSVSDDGLERARASGVVIERHPPAKDATDAELAVDAAVAQGATSVVIVSGSGPGPDDRFDHLLATVFLLGAQPRRRVRSEAWVGRAHLAALHGPDAIVVPARAGETLTLLPVAGAARGITTAGLRYPLHGEDLEAGTSRGVSNIADLDNPTVTVEQGSLLVIRPEALT